MIAVYLIQRNGSDDYYIGSSANLKKRWREHVGNLRRGTHHSRYMQNVWGKYGEGCFSLAVLEEVADVADLVSREQAWLDRFKPVYNSCPTAGSTLGVKRTPEQRAVLSEVARRKRRPLTPEHRAAISARQLGRKGPRRSDAWRAEHAKTMTGRKHSEETKAKIAAAARLRRHSEETRRAISISLRARSA